MSAVEAPLAVTIEAAARAVADPLCVLAVAPHLRAHARSERSWDAFARKVRAVNHSWGGAPALARRGEREHAHYLRMLVFYGGATLDAAGVEGIEPAWRAALGALKDPGRPVEHD